MENYVFWSTTIELTLTGIALIVTASAPIHMVMGAVSIVTCFILVLFMMV